MLCKSPEESQEYPRHFGKALAELYYKNQRSLQLQAVAMRKQLEWANGERPPSVEFLKHKVGDSWPDAQLSGVLRAICG